MIQWRFEERDCPICEESRRNVTELGKRGGSAHHASQGVATRIVRCCSCHGVYASPTPIPQGNPYLEHSPDAYFRQHDSAAKVASGERLALEAERLMGAPGRMLEIGCGRGELLRGAANRGWKVAGVDLTEPYAAVARSEFDIEVEIAPAESARALDRTWDVVVLAAVLEHLYEPLRLLERVASALRPDGVLFIDVPNECSLYTYLGNAYLTLSGRDWAMNLSPTFSPYHVVGFCPRSLKSILTRTGFDTVKLRSYRMTSSFHPRHSGLRAWMERSGLELALTLGQVLGMGAGLVCWARRS